MTKIPWTEVTINPWVGCTKVADGCKNCYAERQAVWLRGMGQKIYGDVLDGNRWNGKIAYQMNHLDKLRRMRKPRMVFLFSMSDPFHEDVPFEQMDKVMAAIALCPQHTFQILTKRIERAAEYYSEMYKGKRKLGDSLRLMNIDGIVNRLKIMSAFQYTKKSPSYKPFRNLWLGPSISTQADADKNIPISLQIPAAVHIVSIEPLLEVIKPRIEWAGKMHWAIIGTESGPNRRKVSIDAVRETVGSWSADCAVFVKQIEINGKCSKDPEEWLKDLRVQEYPVYEG